MPTKAFQQFHPVIGSLTAYQASNKLEEIGYSDIAKTIRFEGGEKLFSSINWPGSNQPRPWQYTSHAFGFISPTSSKTEPVDIIEAGGIEPDTSLRNSRIKVALSRLRVFDYPGGGIHQILFDFYGQNQVQGQTEDVHFTQTYRVQQGEQAGIIGYPVFIGLNVGSEGVDFQCHTVNVKNEEDEKLIEFLDSDIFKKGLSLVSTLNPAVPVITSFATGLTNAIANRNSNVGVQQFYMGLDFSDNPMGARLAQGSYIAVQVPRAEEWDWTKWVFNPKNGQIVPRDNLTGSVPYNYLVFSVDKMSS
jgi:hypothetical protein